MNVLGTPGLSDAQVAQFWRDGFLSRLPVFDETWAAARLAELEAIEAEQAEKHGGAWTDRDFRPWKGLDHPLRAWAEDICRSERFLDTLEPLVGPNLLIRNADVFEKAPGTGQDIRWHRDTAELGPETDGLFTAWIGLTPSTVENGCMVFVRGSHTVDLTNAPESKHALTLSRDALRELDPSNKVRNVMEAGMVSVHHMRTVHASRKNRSTARRVGFVVRLMNPTVSNEAAECGTAWLARGALPHDRFQLKPAFPMTWTSA